MNRLTRFKGLCPKNSKGTRYLLGYSVFTVLAGLFLVSPAWANSPPVINSMVANPVVVSTWSVSTISCGASDADLDAQLTEFSRPEYDNRLKSDAGFQKTVYGLMKRKAEKDPSWRSMIPTAWITKFETQG